MAEPSENRIEKIVELAAPLERVWRALTDYQEFGRWFRVKLNEPFEPGGKSTGWITAPGFEHVEWLATVEEMETHKLFSFSWNFEIEGSGRPLAEEPKILVEFRLEPTEAGTKLTIVESGFAAIPEPHRAEALRRNREGWAVQADHITEYVTS